MRTSNICIRKAGESLKAVRAGFLAAWKGGKYKGENFDFESPAALFRVLTPKRWELIECLQAAGPLGGACLGACFGPRREAGV